MQINIANLVVPISISKMKQKKVLEYKRERESNKIMQKNHVTLLVKFVCQIPHFFQIAMDC